MTTRTDNSSHTGDPPVWGNYPYTPCVPYYTPVLPQPYTPSIHPLQYGWLCPKCSRVNAPSVQSCPCSPPTVTITTPFITGVSLLNEERKEK